MIIPGKLIIENIQKEINRELLPQESQVLCIIMDLQMEKCGYVYIREIDEMYIKYNKIDPEEVVILSIINRLLGYGLLEISNYEQILDYEESICFSVNRRFFPEYFLEHVHWEKFSVVD